MSRQMIMVLAGLSVCPLLAVGVAIYMLASGQPQMMVTAGVVLVLSCGLLAGATVLCLMLSRHEDWIDAQQDVLQALTDDVEQALNRCAAAERRAAHVAPAAEIETLLADVGALRRDFHELLTRRAGPPPQAAPAAPAAASPRPEAAKAKAQPDAQTPPAAPARAQAQAQAQAGTGRDQLTLLLEPVIELASGATSHYRALVGLTDGNGRLVAHEELMKKAEQGGMRTALDLRMLRMVAPVVRRMRNRNPGLKAIVPMGPSVLTASADAAQLLALLQRESDVAEAIVLEFAQQELGRLDATGVDNLARLARAGATLALRDIYLGGLDLAALRQLGVRFLSFPPHAVDAGSGVTPAWTEFAARAKAAQMQLVVGPVKTPQQATAVGRVARFGHGPFFAPPRKVRPDAGVAPAASASAARPARVA